MTVGFDDRDELGELGEHEIAALVELVVADLAVRRARGTERAALIWKKIPKIAKLFTDPETRHNANTIQNQARAARRAGGAAGMDRLRGREDELTRLLAADPKSRTITTAAARKQYARNWALAHSDGLPADNVWVGEFPAKAWRRSKGRPARRGGPPTTGRLPRPRTRYSVLLRFVRRREGSGSVLVSIFTYVYTIDLTIQPSGKRLRRDNSEYGSFVGPLGDASGLRVEFYVVTKWNPSHGAPEECTPEEFDRWTASCEDYRQGVREAERLFYRAHGMVPASPASRFLRRSQMRLPGKHLRSYRARKRCERRVGALRSIHHDVQSELLDRLLDTTGEEAEEIVSETLPPLYRSRPSAPQKSAAHRGRRKRRKRT